VRWSVSGSFATGKTTLVQQVAKVWNHKCGRLMSLTETAREIIFDGFPLDKSTTPRTVLEYIARQLGKERQTLEAEFLLADRSLVDLLACVIVEESAGRMVGVSLALKEIVNLEGKYFDGYIILPIEWPAIPDGVREVDETYRRQLESALISALQTSGARVEVVTGNLEERVLRTIDLLQGAVPPRCEPRIAEH